MLSPAKWLGFRFPGQVCIEGQVLEPGEVFGQEKWDCFHGDGGGLPVPWRLSGLTGSPVALVFSLVAPEVPCLQTVSLFSPSGTTYQTEGSQNKLEV